MDITAIGGAIGAVKALVGMTKATAEAIVDEKQREKLYEIRAGLMDLQERVLEDQSSRMDLLKKLDELGKELDAMKAGADKVDAYELYQIQPGRHVYRSKPQVTTSTPHFVCPNCISSTKTIGVLQVEGGYNGQTRYWCTLCKFDIFV